MKFRLAYVLAVALAAALAAGLISRSASARLSHTGSHAAIPLLRIGDDNAINSLDQFKNADSDLVKESLEGLLKFEPNGALGPLLASSFAQTNPTTYVFHLRKGVTFWNGDPMTSADVVNALNYYREPKSQVASHYALVKSVTAPDSGTVVITLKHPDSSWIQNLVFEGPIFEKKFQQQVGAKLGEPGTLTMGTGPFVIDSYDPTTGFEMTANSHWWGGPVNVQHITIKYFQNETSEALAFRAGEIDIAEDVLNARSFMSTSGVKSLLSTPAFSVGYFGMNYHQGPWSDIHVRRAVAYAIDRSAVIKALGNNAVQDTTLIPENQLSQIATKAQIAALIKSLPGYSYNLAKAKQELAQSKYPNGFSDTTVSLQFGAYIPVTEVIAAAVKKIGINLKLKVLSFNGYIAALTGPRTLGGTYLTLNVGSPDPSAFPALMVGKQALPKGDWNWANYDPPSMDTLVTAGTAAQSKAKRFAIYSKMLKQLAVDEPYVPLFNQDYNIALSSKFTWPGGYNLFEGFGPWELHLKATS